MYYFDHADHGASKAAQSLLDGFLQANPEYTLGILEKQHARIVNDTWKYGNESTMERTYRLIDHGLTRALFYKGEPVSWCLLQDYGGLGMTYTLEAHRRSALSLLSTHPSH